jgi:hypothetical protein
VKLMNAVGEVSGLQQKNFYCVNSASILDRNTTHYLGRPHLEKYAISTKPTPSCVDNSSEMRFRTKQWDFELQE